ncbi:MAG: sugar phosphate isomerase/epimerase [Planctomycetes bacterium]|nr:sugar phosphate isomerase/epimerase [Planctomycetota bacterium]
MEIGIFTRTFTGALDEILDAIVGHGLTCAHLSVASAGVAGLPGKLDEDLCVAVRGAFERRGLRMVTVSGTFNAIHPDPTVRKQGIRGVQRLIQACDALGTRMVTFCTGTRNRDNMWQYHPDNIKREAWADLLSTLGALIPTAEAHGVMLGIEPDQGNVVDSAIKARMLLDEMKSKQLRIVLDGANLFHHHALSDMTVVLKEAFELLGPDIEIVHAKDITGDDTKKNQAAGTGLLDWPTYFRLMKSSGFDGPLLLHNMKPSQVATSVQFVRRQVARWYPELGNTRELM